MLRKRLTLAFLLAAIPTMGFAQSNQNDRACRGDASRLCRKVLAQGDMVILQCLQTNRAKLSRGCRKVLEDNGQL